MVCSLLRLSVDLSIFYGINTFSKQKLIVSLSFGLDLKVEVIKIKNRKFTKSGNFLHDGCQAGSNWYVNWR